MLAFSLFPGDTVLLIVLLGIIVGALGGRLMGGIRVAFFLLSLALALSLGHLLAGLGLLATMTELIGFKNPLWLLLIPRLLATLLLMLAFFAVLESVHRKIYLHYKYKHKDDLDGDSFDTWEYLNDIWGLTLGVGASAICLIVLFSWLHVPGYLLLQVRPSKICERVDPLGHRLLRRICLDMHSLGLNGLAAKFGPAERRYYSAADTVGYIYHNYGRTNLHERHRFHQRVFNYPGIIPLLQQKEIQALQNNPAFLQLWHDNTNFYHITDHTNVAPLLIASCSPNDDNGTSATIFSEHLAKLNLEDYLNFLREGQSDVYKTDNPNQAAVIGTWQLAVGQTYERLRRRYPQAHERGHLAVLNFLGRTAFLQSTTQPPVRQYDWILTFTANKKVTSHGRFFPSQPLFVLEPKVLFDEPPIIRHSTLQAIGNWNKPDSGQNDYEAKFYLFKRNSASPTAIPVLISPANDHLIISFPDNYNREEYVFRRYEF